MKKPNFSRYQHVENEDFRRKSKSKSRLFAACSRSGCGEESKSSKIRRKLKEENGKWEREGKGRRETAPHRKAGSKAVVFVPLAREKSLHSLHKHLLSRSNERDTNGKD